MNCNDWHIYTHTDNANCIEVTHIWHNESCCIVGVPIRTHKMIIWFDRVLSTNVFLIHASRHKNTIHLCHYSAEECCKRHGLRPNLYIITIGGHAHSHPYSSPARPSSTAMIFIAPIHSSCRSILHTHRRRPAEFRTTPRTINES